MGARFFLKLFFGESCGFERHPAFGAEAGLIAPNAWAHWAVVATRRNFDFGRWVFASQRGLRILVKQIATIFGAKIIRFAVPLRAKRAAGFDIHSTDGITRRHEVDVTLQHLLDDARLSPMRRAELTAICFALAVSSCASVSQTIRPSIGGFSARSQATGLVSREALVPLAEIPGNSFLSEDQLIRELSRKVEVRDGLTLVVTPVTEPLVHAREVRSAERDRLPASHLERRLRMKRRIYTAGKFCFQLEWVGRNIPDRESLAQWNWAWDQEPTSGERTREKLTMVEAPTGSRALGCVIRTGQWQPDWNRPFRVLASAPEAKAPVALEWIPKPTFR